MVADRWESALSRGGLHLEEDEARYFFRQFVSAVGYCHANNVAHRCGRPRRAAERGWARGGGFWNEARGALHPAPRAPRQLVTLALNPETCHVTPCTLPPRPQRDLKLDNTLLDGSMAAPRIKICDFGAPLGLPLPRLPLVPSREAAQRKSPAAAVGTPYACLQCGALP